MNYRSAFLSIDDDAPLGVFIADMEGFSVIPLSEFAEESKIDMSKSLAGKYADVLQQFVDELREHSQS